MAFMMPVMKNDWDIYKSNRSRKTSECSNSSGCRSRKVSECRSECQSSLSSSPSGADYIASPHRSHSYSHSSSYHPPQTAMQQRQFSRNSSKSSLGQSPSKSMSNSPPKNGTSTSSGSLNKFHTRLVDKLKRSLKRDGSAGTDERSSWYGEKVEGNEVKEIWCKPRSKSLSVPREVVGKFEFVGVKGMK